MFILTLRYIVPLADVDRHYDDHIAWLEDGYASGMFLASGREVPRRGGVILARGERSDVEAMAARDPFVTGRVATCDVSEFDITTTVDGLGGLRSG